MKRFLALALALFAASAFATTFVPPALINPVGSTSGQVVMSTGPSTAPGWSNITSLNAPFLGAATATTQSVGVSNTTVATTNYVTSEIASGAQGGAFTTLSASANDALLYQNTSAQSIPTSTATTITGWTKVSDRVNANFNASTGIFTAPATGIYKVSGQENFAAAAWVVGQQVQLCAVANSVTVACGSNAVQASGTFNMFAILPSTAVALTAGQTLVLQAFQSGSPAHVLGAAATQTFISINRLP